MVNLAFHSAFPLSTALWWYPTSYALFLIFLPFLNAGMKQLAQRQHKQLAIICLVLWRFLGLIPKINFDLTDKSVFVFIYWYILLSYYRWHMKKNQHKAVLDNAGDWCNDRSCLATWHQFVVQLNGTDAADAIVHI